MGNGRSKRVLQRVADALARLGGDPRGARPRSGRSARGETVDAGASAAMDPSDSSDDAATGRPVTDGGADGAPPGESPWAEDDPIVFGEDVGTDHGTALLDAVTDPGATSAPPFGSEESTDDATDHDAEPSGEDGVGPQRIDELEARIEALESDHALLESSMTDVERGVASLHDEVTTIGDDVGRLVAVLGGIAIARDGADESEARHDDVADLAAAFDGIDADELIAAVAEPTSTPDAEGGVDAAPRDDEADPERSETSGDPAPSSAAYDDATSGGEAQEEIQPGAGTPPQPAETAESDSAVERTASVDAPMPSGADEPARELVDPRTDAVGARLRQFREGFVDDPTADLPTRDAADEFRFDKVLLPTEGDAAPDISNAELEKPYIEELPDGYAADAVVLEWLDWLVSAADGEVAARAVAYYESIEWLTAGVRADLLGYLDGLEPTEASAEAPGATGDEGPIGEPPAALDLQDHLRSLQYVTELASGEVGTDGI